MGAEKAVIFRVVAVPGSHGGGCLGNVCKVFTMTNHGQVRLLLCQLLLLLLTREQ